MKRRNYILVAFLMLAIFAGGVNADTTFGWTGPQNSGTLWYDGLYLTNVVVNGGTASNVTSVGGVSTGATINAATIQASTLVIPNTTFTGATWKAGFTTGTVVDVGSVHTGGTYISTFVTNSTKSGGFSTGTIVNTGATFTDGTYNSVVSAADDASVDAVSPVLSTNVIGTYLSMQEGEATSLEATTVTQAFINVFDNGVDPFLLVTQDNIASTNATTVASNQFTVVFGATNITYKWFAVGLRP